MKLIQCRYSSGQRVPLLVQTGDAAPLPTLVPFIYVQLKLRYLAYNTAAAHLCAIQTFYTYAKTRDLDIDEAILASHFDAILALLDGYAIWQHSGRHADNLVARTGTAAIELYQVATTASCSFGFIILRYLLVFLLSLRRVAFQHFQHFQLLTLSRSNHRNMERCQHGLDKMPFSIQPVQCWRGKTIRDQ